jgi:hypothetical protein
MMATKRRSHIFARSRVTELRSPTGIRDGSFFDEPPTTGVKVG